MSSPSVRPDPIVASPSLRLIEGGGRPKQSLRIARAEARARAAEARMVAAREIAAAAAELALERRTPEAERVAMDAVDAWDRASNAAARARAAVLSAKLSARVPLYLVEGG